MRKVLILTTALALGACEGWSSYSEDEEAEAAAETAHAPDSLEFEQEAAEAYKAEQDREEAEDSAAADLSAPAGTARGAVSCGDQGDAETFVRCVYAGLESGAIDFTNADHVGVVWYGGYSADQADRVEEFRRTPLNLRENMARIQHATLCACTEPDPAAFRIRSVTVGPVSEDRTQARVTPASGGVVVIELARQNGAWFIDDARRG